MRLLRHCTPAVLVTIGSSIAFAVSIGRRLVIVLALVSILLSIGPWSVRSSDGQTVPIPERALWESQMVSYGQSHCVALMQPGQTVDQQLGATYYDLTRVMYQIADYTGQSSWKDCATTARAVYGDGYVLPNNGGVPGYWNFSTGLRMDYERTGYSESQVSALLLSTNAAFARDLTPLDWTYSAEYSREVAYTILSYINAESMGAAPRARRVDLVNQAYDHMAQWFVRFEWLGTTQQVAPFMVGLTAHTLSRDWEQTQDTRLIPTLRTAADWLWANAWDPTSQSMYYQINPQAMQNGVPYGIDPAPDLNLLIAPMYAFLYWQTGETKYRDQGDALFAGGVTSAWLVGTKQFNQNYWWAFDYVKWRSTPPVTPSGSTSPAPPALSVVVTAPTSGTSVQSTVTVAATASTTATRVDLRLDGSLVAAYSGASASYSWNTTTVGNGTHRWVARAYDSSGTTADSAPVDVVVNNPDTTPPVVALNLLSGAVARRSRVTLGAMASDNVGVVKVEFYVSGTLLCSDTTSPYTCAWNVPAAANKSYVLQAKAYDATGNVGVSTPVTVVAK